jgi:hypothetical protein
MKGKIAGIPQRLDASVQDSEHDEGGDIQGIALT